MTTLNDSVATLLDYKVRLRDSIARDSIEIHHLAISGGGPFGAFSAGFLNGWPDRPKFDIVTGVSTGALVSTAAFTGNVSALKKPYTETTDRDVYRRRPLVVIPFAKSIHKTKRLRRLVERLIQPELPTVRAGLAEKRLLVVGAAGIQRGVWQEFDLTQLAGRDDLDGFVDSLMASAALPVLFPPVEIGNDYYVDGGVRNHLFSKRICQAAQAWAARNKKPVKVTVYLLANWDGTTPGTRIKGIAKLDDIARGSIGQVMDEMMRSDIYQLYMCAKAASAEFKMADAVEYVGPVARRGMLFDAQFMSGLYEWGEKQGRDEAWLDKPRPEHRPDT